MGGAIPEGHTRLTNRRKPGHGHMILAGPFTDALRLDAGESVDLTAEETEVQRKSAAVAQHVASGELGWEGSAPPTRPAPRRRPAHDPTLRAEARHRGLSVQSLGAGGSIAEPTMVSASGQPETRGESKRPKGGGA